MSADKIKKYLEEYSYLKSIQALLHWDMETMMPKGAIDDRARRLSYIQGKMHSHITSKKYQNLLSDLKTQKLKPLEKKLLKELMWDFNLSHAFPLKHVMELSEASTHATHAWASARAENNWESFRPHLEKLVELKKRETTFFKVKNPYDALLQMHDKEFTSTEIATLFDELKTGLSKLVVKVKKNKILETVTDLQGPFPILIQKELSEFVAQSLGLSPDRSRLDISVHPFSINISPTDQRITTRYNEADLDSLSSTMHEVGHALYEANLPSEWEGTPFQEAISLSVHESQSRFWENVIGRSAAFTHFIMPKMRKCFPAAMKGIDEERLFLIFNKSVPGLIRVESCELYYNFHVIIRFEIEKMIFNENLKVSDIPEVWNNLYEKYLGIRLKSFSEGLMQDSHWAGGAFGYFPTYSLGNLISGSLYQKMKNEVPRFSQNITQGEFAPILDYLVKNIHSKGRSITASDVVGKLAVKDYLDYLNEKF